MPAVSHRKPAHSVAELVVYSHHESGHAADYGHNDDFQRNWVAIRSRLNGKPITAQSLSVNLPLN